MVAFFTNVNDLVFLLLFSYVFQNHGWKVRRGQMKFEPVNNRGKVKQWSLSRNVKNSFPLFLIKQQTNWTNCTWDIFRHIGHGRFSPVQYLFYKWRYNIFTLKASLGSWITYFRPLHPPKIARGGQRLKIYNWLLIHLLTYFSCF